MRFLSDARNIFYSCRQIIIKRDGDLAPSLFLCLTLKSSCSIWQRSREMNRNEITVKRLNGRVTDPSQVAKALDEAGCDILPIDCNNWGTVGDGLPNVSVRIAHQDNSIILEFKVTDSVRRATQHDNERIWEDSCVEFFVMPDANEPFYYNIEANCVGNILIGSGEQRRDRVRAGSGILKSVMRFSNLGSELFGLQKGEKQWSVALIIPVTVFFRNRPIASLHGMQGRANFYKCGDLLPHPHYLSFSEVDSPRPDFHRPESFVALLFQ